MASGSSFRLPAAGLFWLAIVLTGLATGVCAAGLMLILQAVQHYIWPGANLLDGAAGASPEKHVVTLLLAGLATGVGQIVLVQVTSGSIDITEAIW